MSAPVDRRLLARLGSAHLSVAAGVALGLVATACVAVQAVLLARLLAGAMRPGHIPPELQPTLIGLAAATMLRASTALVGELAGRSGAERVKGELRRALLLAVVGGRSGRAGSRPADPAVAPGALATLAGPGLDALDVYVARCLPDLVLGVVAPVALLVVVGLIDWPSALIVLVVLGLFPLFGALVGHSSASLAKRRLADVGALGDRLVDVFAGLPALRSFGRAREQREVLAAANEALRRSSLAALRVAFLSALVLDTLASISTALVAVPLGLRLLDGSVQLAPALAVLVLAPEVFLPMRRASAEFHESTAGLAAASTVLDALGAPSVPAPDLRAAPAPDLRSAPAPDLRSAPAPAPEADVRGGRPGRRRRQAVVELRDVAVRLGGAPEPLFDGMSLHVAAGERVAIIGPSGAGKSTLLGLVLGFVAPASGTVLVDGTSLDELDHRAWLARTAYLPERPALLAATLGENLRLAALDADDAACCEALVRAGGSELLDALGGDLATPVGDGGRPLSAGQRQRVGLARMLLRPASIYLLDEPTAHLDEDSELRAVAALDAAIGSRAAIVVTHRNAVLALADRVLRLEPGELGGPASLRRASIRGGAGAARSGHVAQRTAQSGAPLHAGAGAM